MSKGILRLRIEQAFNEDELRTLCYDLNIDYENLGGRGKAANVRELVLYCERRNLLPLLIQQLHILRPDVSWESLLHDEIYSVSIPSPIYGISASKINSAASKKLKIEELLTNIGIVLLTAFSAVGGVIFLNILAKEYYNPNDYGLFQSLIVGNFANSEFLVFAIIILGLLLGGLIGFVVYNQFRGPLWLKIVLLIFLGFIAGVFLAPLACPLIAVVALVGLSLMESNSSSSAN